MLLHHSPGSTGARRVFLAIPTYGPVPALTTFCLFESHAALIAAGYEVELGLLTGHCHVDDARNLLVRDFLGSSCDELMFIDADMGWQAAQLVSFLAHDRDVVAGTYPQKKDEQEFPCRLLPGEIWSDSDGLIEVDGVPTGFLKIKRHVLQTLSDLSRKYLANAEDLQECAEVFVRDVVNGRRISGDYNFCRRWRELGGRVFIDPELYLEHTGEKTWRGSYGAHLRMQNGLALTRGIARIRAGQETHQDIIDLMAEWGGNQWAAGPELLLACLQVARQARGPVIEAGSGLTSLIMAAAGAEVHALEHDPVWLSKILEESARFQMPNLRVHFAPLKDYPSGRWYSHGDLPWKTADIVLCDGPPRQGNNREVLFEQMAQFHCRPRCILRDDTARLESPFSDWLTHHGYRAEIKGQLRKFAVGVLNG